jgi:hypothetical protein
MNKPLRNREFSNSAELISAEPINDRNFDNRQAKQIELLALRSFELADRVASGELQFLDAVDVAFDAAVASGLADAVGDDIIQAVLSTAFEKVRP